MEEQIKRLEAVTNRLESIVGQLSSANTNNTSNHVDNSEQEYDHLPVLKDYQTLLNDDVQPFLAISQKIGGDLSTMTEHVQRLFNAQQQFIKQAVLSKKPADQKIAEAVKPQTDEIQAISDFTSKNRKSPLFNHLSAISEGIPALCWILVSPTPAPHVKDMTEAAQFYSNRVLKEFREQNPMHVEWVKLWVKTLNDLHAYIRQHHTTGLAWASQGKREFGSISQTTVKPAPAAGGPPPPPPPPPPPMPDFDKIVPVDNSRNELMSSINSLGEGVTAHLKKVPETLKTHKNPELRRNTEGTTGSHDDSGSAKKGHGHLVDGKPVVPPKPGKTTPPQNGNRVHNSQNSAPAGGTPKLILEGNKWLVEFQNGKSDLKITETSMRQSIYIYKCTNCTITVEGKVNSIVLDQCNKVGIQFTSVVSLIEFVNCRSMKAQVLERVPTIQIEKTDGCHIYLSETSLDTEFITSKSSEMSVNVPVGDGEYKEYPIAEQFKTHFQNGKQLVTMPNESAGV